ncbi:hypothetical protein V5O48_018990, partial [Marasmius crinis-equi]
MPPQSNGTNPFRSLEKNPPSRLCRRITPYDALNAMTIVTGSLRQLSPPMFIQFNMLQELWPLVALWTVVLLGFVVYGWCMISRLLEHTNPDRTCHSIPFFRCSRKRSTPKEPKKVKQIAKSQRTARKSANAETGTTSPVDIERSASDFEQNVRIPP